jgi:hypothetical protein
MIAMIIYQKSDMQWQYGMITLIVLLTVSIWRTINKTQQSSILEKLAVSQQVYP